MVVKSSRDTEISCPVGGLAAESRANRGSRTADRGILAAAARRTPKSGASTATCANAAGSCNRATAACRTAGSGCDTAARARVMPSSMAWGDAANTCTYTSPARRSWWRRARFTWWPGWPATSSAMAAMAAAARSAE